MDDQATTPCVESDDIKLMIKRVCLVGWNAHEAYARQDDLATALRHLRELRDYLDTQHQCGLLNELYYG